MPLFFHLHTHTKWNKINWNKKKALCEGGAVGEEWCGRCMCKPYSISWLYSQSWALITASVGAIDTSEVAQLTLELMMHGVPVILALEARWHFTLCKSGYLQVGTISIDEVCE